jgi:hypothetical protein
MRIDTKKPGSAVSRWLKNALCIGMVMGLSMSMGTAFADNDDREDRGKDRKEKHEGHKGKNKGDIMTPFARIAKIKVVKGKRGKIDYEATYEKARAVALAIATYVDGVNDYTESGFPADWIVGGMEGGSTIEEAILKIPSPEPIDPDDLSLGTKSVNVMDLCNAYYAKQALGVAPIAGTDKTVVNGYSHATALPCEVSTWNDDEHIYVDMLDPNAIFSIFFTDVLISDDMLHDPDFAAAITALPVTVKSEIKTVVYNALDVAGIKYKAKDKQLGPKYKSVEDIFEVVAASPNVSPYMHVAYTKSSGDAFEAGETSVVAQAIINTMSIHGEPDAGTHDPELESLLSANSKWRSARHEPLGLPGTPEKNWVIEACSPTYAKMAMGTGMHHATALPCEIAVQRVDRDGDGTTESLVISYLDPFFMFGAMFADMTDEEKDDLGDVPGYIISDLQNIVQFALDTSGTELDKGVQFWYSMLP